MTISLMQRLTQRQQELQKDINRALAWHSILQSSAPQRNGPPQRNEPQVLCRLFNTINPHSSTTIAIYTYLCILLPSSDTALFNWARF
jgi:hypothetical protein